MVKVVVKTATDTATKWAEEAPRRAVYYEKEAPLAADRWEKGASAASGTYKAAVTAPDIGKRFAGGIRGKASKFARKVKDVGVARYGPGITAAKGDYEEGIAWVLSEIAATDIPERKPRGDPGNWDRSMKIGVALNKKRLARLAAG